MTDEPAADLAAPDPAPVAPPEVDASILPTGYLGFVAPMNSLGFALNPAIGVVYDEVIAMLPAQALVFTFQQNRAAERARVMPYDEAASHHGVRIIRLSDLEKVELIRPVTGYRLVVSEAGHPEQKWILQKPDVDEIRRALSQALGDRFVDTTT